MLKHIALIAMLSLAIGIPVAAAQSPDGAGRPRPLQKLVRIAQGRIRLGVRAGRITPAELARLRADAAALRSQIQTIRRSGARPTPTERQQIRQALRNLNREIVVASHNRIRRGR